MATLLVLSARPATAAESEMRAGGWHRAQEYGLTIYKKKKPRAPASQEAAKPHHPKPHKGIVSGRAQVEVTRAVRQLAIAQDLADIAQHELDQVTDDLEEAQPSDSPFTEAKDKYDAASTAHSAAIDDAQKSTAYKQAVEKASLTGDQASQVADAYEKLVKNDPQVLETAATLSAAKKEYEPLLKKLLQDDPDWVAASDKLKAARQAVTDAQTALHSAELNQLAAAGPIPGLTPGGSKTLDPAAQQKADAKTAAQEDQALKKFEAGEKGGKGHK